MKSYLITKQSFNFSFRCPFCGMDSGIVKKFEITASDREFFIAQNSANRGAEIENHPSYIVGKNHGYKSTCIMNLAKRGIYPVKIPLKCPNCGDNIPWSFDSITVDDAPKMKYDDVFRHKKWYKVSGGKIKVTWDECSTPEKAYSIF